MTANGLRDYTTNSQLNKTAVISCRLKMFFKIYKFVVL